MVNYRASQSHLNTPKYAGDFKQQIHLKHTLHNSGNYLATCIYERVKQREKNQLSVSSHLMWLIEEGKTRFMYLQNCPSKSANVTLGKRKKTGEMALGKHISLEEKPY